jgi:phosphatidylserine/phosphatidylglycerophosphate/cardiolipin synthase-like enzyme
MSEAGSARAVSQVLFSPGVVCRERLAELMETAERSIDVCVYTITDDRLARPLERAFTERGLAVRVITETDKVHDRGADILRLRESGIPVALDTDTQIMHHKFVIFDGKTLATGSFNWTRTASIANHENLIVTCDRHLVRAFQAEFDHLWAMYGDRDARRPRAGGKDL